MLQPNLWLFLHQIFKIILISNPMGYITSPMVAQLYFKFKYDSNVQIQLQQVVAHDKHKRQAKFTR